MKPSITVAMISFNDEKILGDCLKSIRIQDYDQGLVKILMVDGGSLDRTSRIAAEYGADFLSHPELRDFPDVRGGMALSIPTSDLILFFSADNRLQESDVLSRMVAVFSDQDIVGCETLRYGFCPTDPLLSRYFALIGGVDPIAIGLGKADRGPHDFLGWHSFGKEVDQGNFYKVTFEKDISRIPTLGANGFLVRRDVLHQSRLVKQAVHIDICADLIIQGYDTFAFLKDRHVVHFIDVGVRAFIRRKLLLTQMYSKVKKERIYTVFHRKDLFKLILIAVFYPTFFIPLLRAVKGYVKVPDFAWFLHPFMCFVFTLSYAYFYIRSFVFRLGAKIK